MYLDIHWNKLIHTEFSIDSDSLLIEFEGFFYCYLNLGKYKLRFWYLQGRIWMGFLGGSPAQLQDTPTLLLTRTWLWFGKRTHYMTTCLILKRYATNLVSSSVWCLWVLRDIVSSLAFEYTKNELLEVFIGMDCLMVLKYYC